MLDKRILHKNVNVHYTADWKHYTVLEDKTVGFAPRIEGGVYPYKLEVTHISGEYDNRIAIENSTLFYDIKKGDKHLPLIYLKATDANGVEDTFTCIFTVTNIENTKEGTTPKQEQTVKPLREKVKQKVVTEPKCNLWCKIKKFILKLFGR